MPGLSDPVHGFGFFHLVIENKFQSSAHKAPLKQMTGHTLYLMMPGTRLIYGFCPLSIFRLSKVSFNPNSAGINKMFNLHDS